MFKNYLKVALRHLTKNKSYVIINTLGMGIALTCCMTAYLLVAYNLEFDNSFPDDQVKDIVKVMHHLEQPNGRHYQQLVVPIVMAPIAAQEISGIDQFTRYCSDGAYVSYGDKAFSENIYFADSTFFKMFPQVLRSGAYKNFDSHKSIFLSERLAKKYFAEEDPIGKMVMVEVRNKQYEVFVGGVLEKVPLNSTFTHEALMRIENFFNVYGIEPNNWSESHDASVLFALNNIEQRRAIGEQMKKYISLRNESKRDSKSTSFELLPFKTPITANDIDRSYLHPRIPFIALFIFMALAIIILLIACFNLTNTTMALTGKRLKEVGVRKVVGSSRWQIINQFLFEMLITIGLAIIAGLLMAQIIVPEFASMWGLQYGLGDLSQVNLLISLIIMLFISAILSGIYPALFNSKFRPVVLLKGGLQIKGTNWLTRALLVTQFSLSVMVLVAGIVFIQNAEFQQRIGFGYDKDQLISVSLQGIQEYERLKGAILSNPKIENVAVADNHIGPYSSYYRTIQLDTAELNTNVYEVGADYFKVVGLDFTAGRDFVEGNEADQESSVIVDENFVKKMKLTNALETEILYQGISCRIVGVVKNHLSGLKNNNDKDHLYKMAKPDQYHFLVARTDAANILETQDYIEAQWKKIYAGKPFQSSLQDDIIYKEANEYNKNLKQIFIFLTVLGCLLSVSGIYSLASLNVQKRVKEIGVRKVLGASVSSVVALVNKEFAIILTLAVIFGGISGFAMTDALLSNLYVQRIDVGVLPVFLSGLLIFSIGIFTTSGTIFRAASINPTRALKHD